MYSIETKQPDTDYVLQFKFLRPLSAVSAEYGGYRQVFFSFLTILHYTADASLYAQVLVVCQSMQTGVDLKWVHNTKNIFHTADET